MSLASLFDSVVGAGAAQPIDAVGNVIDKLFTSDEERLDKQALLIRLAQVPGLAQVELNKVEAQHRSIFVAGWRPFIGWICGVNLLYLVLLRDLIAWAIANFAPQVTPPPAIGLDISVELVTALLGLGALRTVEKFGGRAR